jgi:hypothetical protein
MADPVIEISPEFQRGWDAALIAVRFWHESQAKKALVQARRRGSQEISRAKPRSIGGPPR